MTIDVIMTQEPELPWPMVGNGYYIPVDGSKGVYKFAKTGSCHWNGRYIHTNDCNCDDQYERSLDDSATDFEVS